MRSKKFVLDPNIIISYIISNNKHLLASIVIKHKIEIVICDELIEELKRVLGYERLAKHNIDISQAAIYLKTIGTHYTLQYPIKRYIPDDENDDYLIALALQTSSGFITSGDNDILSQKAILEQKFKKLRIITKAEFERMLA